MRGEKSLFSLSPFSFCWVKRDALAEFGSLKRSRTARSSGILWRVTNSVLVGLLPNRFVTQAVAFRVGAPR